MTASVRMATLLLLLAVIALAAGLLVCPFGSAAGSSYDQPTANHRRGPWTIDRPTGHCYALIIAPAFWGWGLFINHSFLARL